MSRVTRASVQSRIGDYHSNAAFFGARRSGLPAEPVLTHGGRGAGRCRRMRPAAADADANLLGETRLQSPSALTRAATR
jgi:hypothetical protein